MSHVILENVTKVYPGGVKAVQELSVEIEDKEFLVIVGPSGCGKSTILRMIAGLEEVSCGTIRIGNRAVNDVPPKDRDIAMVFQNYALYPHMTVFDNMAFGLKLRKFRKTEIEQRVTEAAEILGITELLARRPRALSGGQRQRVAVGRAIVRRPQVFLFDEPLSNLDAKMRVQMRVEISRLHRRLNSTMIYVTHDQTEAMTMGDRIVVIDSGVVQQIADPITLYDRPANRFVAGFIGTPPMNFVDGAIGRADGGLVFDEGTFTVAVPTEWEDCLDRYAGRQVVLGLRPEDIGSAAAEQLEGAPRITAKVEVCQPTGSECYLYLSAGRHMLVSRQDSHHSHAAGTTADLAVFMPKGHFFSPDDGKTIV